MIYEGISGSSSHRNLPYICLVVHEIKLILSAKLLEEYTVELFCLPVVVFDSVFHESNLICFQFYFIFKILNLIYMLRFNRFCFGLMFSFVELY